MSMFYWLRVTGGTPLHKFDWEPGPWPKEDAEKLRTRIIEKHPGLAAGITPAWEGPFEDMIRVRVTIHRFGKPSGSRWLFVYRASADRYFAFYGNLRCSSTIYRQSPYAHQIGQEIGGDTAHSFRLTQADLAEIEHQLQLKAPGDGVWDSGWSPAQPER